MSPGKGGDLRTESTGERRVLVGALLCGALLGLPLLLLGTGAVVSSALPAGAGGGRTVATAASRARVVIPDLEQAKFAEPTISTTTTTVAPPTTTDPPPTTVASPPPTKARAAVVTTTTTAPSDTAVGLATWYAEAPAGRCASTSLPFGTELTVTDNATGASITCLVDDRETAGPPHLVDLSPEGFSALAPLSQGVIGVTVTW
jgi:rare lipoprotein A (peptidoglycan hydrolase)